MSHFIEQSQKDLQSQDALLKILGPMPGQTNKPPTLLKAAWIETILGPMIALADEECLYLLEFITTKGLAREIERFKEKGFVLIPGHTAPLKSIEAELKAYFEGRLKVFKTPYRVFGSVFQKQAWDRLCQIPYGEKRSYAQQAAFIGKPNAYRAVANANGANQLAIMVPCHRIIASDGSLGGYGGGLAIKRWLIDHEKRYHSK
jgi:AraC family transcriptional regulator, regulatory protein of adaptative response / methylated-DNA-[protein]-cysteine methyltransferase